MNHAEGGEVRPPLARRFYGYGPTMILAKNQATLRAAELDYYGPTDDRVIFYAGEWRYSAAYHHARVLLAYQRQLDENTPPSWWADVWRVLEDRFRRIFRR